MNPIKIRFSKLVQIAVALPLGSLFLCIVISVYYHFDEVNATHCNVQNYLPSISSAIGHAEPEKYIWRFGIALHSFLRLAIALVYFQFYQEPLNVVSKFYKHLVQFNMMLNIVENISLLVITYISSVENYEIHKYGFIGFLGCSMTYMVVTIFLFFKLGRIQHSAKNKLSINRKTTLFIGNILAFVFCIYFFWRHNKFCEPGMYSLFAICEYLVVLTNIGFHGTATIDFRDTIVEIPVTGINSIDGKSGLWNV